VEGLVFAEEEIPKDTRSGTSLATEKAWFHDGEIGVIQSNLATFFAFAVR
jgi:hypothetical protein